MIARRDFSFLAESRAPVDLLVGDARLVFEREPDQRFDVLVIDAFSSDSVPTHLLTIEAFELYFGVQSLNDALHSEYSEFDQTRRSAYVGMSWNP